VLTGEIRSQIDGIWNDFWSGGVSNPPALYVPLHASELLFSSAFPNAGRQTTERLEKLECLKELISPTVGSL